MSHVATVVDTALKDPLLLHGQRARHLQPAAHRLRRRGVTFHYKDYRRDGADRLQVMTLATGKFIRRFLLHVLPRGFHRVRHYGLLTGASRQAGLDRARELLAVALPANDNEPEEPLDTRPPCPCCGGAWWSSRPSPDGTNRGRRRRAPHQPGERRPDPDCLASQDLAAPLPRATGRFAPAVTAPAATGSSTSHSPRRCDPSPCHDSPSTSDATAPSPCHVPPRDQPKTEIPIALAGCPRVRSSGTFVRLTAPETLHDSGQAAFGD